MLLLLIAKINSFSSYRGTEMPAKIPVFLLSRELSIGTWVYINTLNNTLF